MFPPMNARLALRSIARNRGLAALIIGTMALGIGANTTMFSVIRAVFLRPLAFPHPERIVTLWESDPGAGVGERRVTPANFVDWAAQSKSFEAMGALDWDGFDTVYKIASPDGVDRVRGVYASSDFFRALGVTPELGRFFGFEEDHTSGLRRAIISHAFWQQRFHGDPKVIGQTLDIDTYGGGRFTITGVIAAGREFPVDASIWLSKGDSGTKPLPNPDAAVRCCSWFSVFGRLKPGVTIPQAEAEMAVIASGISARHPDASKVSAVKIVPLREQMVRDQRQVFFALAAAVGFVLLIACANVANLLLSRGVSREKEMQIRNALGASVLQIARQLMAESLVLCLLGTAAGLILAVWAQAALVKVFEDRIPIIATARMDGSVLAFAAAITMLSATLCGLAPLLQARAADWRGRGATESFGSKRLRNALVVGELALSLTLVTGAGLLVRTVLKLADVNFGVRREGVLAVATDFNTDGLREREEKVKYLDELMPRLASLPGVAMAAATTALPMDPTNFDTISPEGRPIRTRSESPRIVQSGVTPDYFQLMGIPLKQGRGFNGGDTPDSKLVAILSETTARRYWPGQDPIGKRFVIGSSDRLSGFGRTDLHGPEWREVVGVVGDVRSGGFGSEVLPMVYYAHRQFAINGPTIVVRTSSLARTGGDPLALAAAVRNEVNSLGNRAVVANIRSMQQVVSDSVSEPRTRAALVGLFAGLALLLGMLGIYGVASHTVTQRTREIGIRMALGARASEVASIVIGGALRLSVIGAGLGLLASLAMARALAGLLFGIQPVDPLTLIGSCGFLMAAAVAASYLPARRAMRIDPAIALRNE
jgi:putative ABC transport system permease protein